MWEKILEKLQLGTPDTGRINRARDEVLPTVTLTEQNGALARFTASIKHTVTLAYEAGGSVYGKCSCQDFTTRQMALGLPCKHLVAVAMWLDGRGASLEDLVQPGAAVAVAGNAWPNGALRLAVGKAIANLANAIGGFLLEGEAPLVIGPTGVGKTTALHKVAEALNFGMEEVAGSESWTEADLIGTWTPAREWVWGPIGRAFSRAQQGETTIMFVDEVTRFNPRAADILLRAIQPLEASLARRMGINVPSTVDEVFVAEAPLLGYRQWAPADNLLWVAAGNPGVNPLDPALVRRFLVLEAQLDRSVLDVLPSAVQTLIGSLWDSYETGELPLPLEYQQLTRARSADDLFKLYHARLRALDVVAAEAVARVLAGNGFQIGGAA
ncbi:MAG: AAA domain (dynein-related subfamily) [Chloroflexi bacterium ADurb.Bin360]|nr:MAG: AAA domain (dynein-related subfamily) [Chloroflexi bacterium ADurb.Bin360]